MNHTMEFTDEYPYNLIQAVRKNTRLSYPITSEKNVHLGIEYVLSKFSDLDRSFIRKRFFEKNSIEQVSKELAITVDEALLQEHSIFKKLRDPSRWNYIHYGIEGYTRIRMEELNRTAYQRGYTDGYQKGIADGTMGISANNAPKSILYLPIKSIGLSSRAYSCLFHAGCERIQDLVALSESQIQYMRNLGPKTAHEIAAKLQEFEVHNTLWDKYL